MLARILKLYTTAMAFGVRSPIPHLAGPPGCGKSTVVAQAAQILQVNLHVINVSRLSPLEVEGVQMPHGEDLEQKLRLLLSTMWTNLRTGDIVLFDEFLRGFPEVYNALLDIFTSRNVAGFQLPEVFIIAASNSVTAYDPALEDRLHHIKVADPRKSKTERARLATLMVEALGLLPTMNKSGEMGQLLDTEVLPMFEMLDWFDGKGSGTGAVLKGKSVRNLIGQALMRDIESSALMELLRMNNNLALSQGKAQYVVLPDGKNPDASYERQADNLRGNPKLTEIQAKNLEINLQLIEMERERTNKEGITDDDDTFIEEPPF